jgi:putative NADH-flavin reductase
MDPNSGRAHPGVKEPETEQHRLDLLQPAGFFEPGQRTGKFRLGKDDLIVDAQGNSRISFQDYAIALVDELENPQHRRDRFTIGY